jgi:hypothetical protein
MVAGAAHQIVETCAFAPEHENDVAGEIETVVIGGAALVESDDPEIVALEIFKRTNEVDDAGDAEMLRGSGTRFNGHGAEWCGTALGEQDALDTGAIGDAKQRTEILRIFHAIEREEKTRGACCRRTIEVFNRKKFLRADERDDTLMRRSFGDEGELLARLLADADAGIAALRDEALQAIVLALAGDKDVIETAAAGFERFLNRMQPVENFHED